MKPDWKGIAKEAYAKGYKEGVKHALEWTPATDPPERSGEYMVLRSSLNDGADDPRIVRTTHNYVKFADGSGGKWADMLFGGVILYWRELPPVPSKVEIAVSIREKWEES